MELNATTSNTTEKGPSGVTARSRFSCHQCSQISGHLAASCALLLLSAISFIIAIATTNWSASGYQMKMGLWDFCITHGQSGDWTCLPVNTDFSVVTQSFSILAAMCYACGFVLYLLLVIFISLRGSRPLTIAVCILAFFIVCLQIMTIIVYVSKHGELYRRIERDYSELELDELYTSWSLYCSCISTILGTVTGVLLFLEFRNLAYESVYSKTPEDTEQTNVTG